MVEDRDIRVFDRRQRAEEVPEHLEVMAHLAAATGHVANILDDLAIKAATRKIELLEEVDLRAIHVGIADKEAAGCKGCDAGADQIGALVIYALRLACMDEGIAVAAVEAETGILRLDMVVHLHSYSEKADGSDF